MEKIKCHWKTGQEGTSWAELTLWHHKQPLIDIVLCNPREHLLHGATRYMPARVDKLYTTKKANGRMRWGASKVLLNSWQQPWKAREFLGFVAAPFQLLPAERLAQPSLCWQWTVLALIILGITANKKCCKGFAFSRKILKNRQPWLVLVTLLNVFKPSLYMATAGCRYFTFYK